MVTSKLALTCCKLVSHSCRVKLAASLLICSASLLQTKIAIWEIRSSLGGDDQGRSVSPYENASWNVPQEVANPASRSAPFANSQRVQINESVPY
ncbi:hypothetical protein AVEN_212889-1 [Araneus ventricosus]|uniref:Uncharacterized protein n=1 Tax=Araneus ventricosus TaxID=182803 RepID=A0A4Y2F9R1_ARAVE|nr:hypothetical protein AVEN_212889-1 [Araneus ventricosus]